MRSWDAYIQLDSTVKNTLTSVRAVGELQNPALRDRHWIQLMSACKQSEPDNEEVVNCFLIENIFALLMKYIENVKNIQISISIHIDVIIFINIRSNPSFVYDPTTTLADLLSLNLHIYEDEVKNIVDKAVKEMSMEKTLKRFGKE
ncbi:hypothetical protein Anas_04768 [Armadillidium nasatum]|uniref:Dynein heavy chain linker domain-containing protein n=1 Tax=Armadillidium nasatum TaxID=96803 RepID=A0A5N5SJV8_9CRUS|nr:hypothetical protein Anas_04768 [Armadillidium nasatum]